MGNKRKDAAEVRFIKRRAYEILEEEHPDNLRHLFYRLSAPGEPLENKEGDYKALSRWTTEMRYAGSLPWWWLVDETRQPEQVSMWEDAADLLAGARRGYQRNVWANQPDYIEVWVEKQALTAKVRRVCDEYGVLLNKGRGFDSTSAVFEMASRLNDKAEKHGRILVLCFGDHDPSGENMTFNLRRKLVQAGCEAVEFERRGLLREDLSRYGLPPAPAKDTDTRTPEFIARHGSNFTAELDALPTADLQARVREEIESRMDLSALDDTHRKQAEDIRKIRRLEKEFAGED